MKALRTSTPPGRRRSPPVVKPARQGSSVGVTLVRERKDLAAACDAAWKFDDKLVVEEFVAGRELTVGVFADRTLPVIEIKHKGKIFDYDGKYKSGQTEYLVPAPLDAQVAARAQFFAQRAHQCLGCRDYSRVDMILNTSGKLFVLEVNTIPGFTDTSLVPKAARAAGMEFRELCVRLVEMALARTEVLAVH